VTPDLRSDLIPEEVKRLLDEGHWKEAVGALDHALEANPRGLTLWREKANILLAINRSDDALACYDHMLQIDPRNPAIYSEKAAVLETVDRDDEALACYDQALAINGLDVTALAGKAQLMARRGKIPDSLAVYDRLLQLKPQDPEILIAKGDALITAGQTDQAASYFEQTAAINPGSFGAAEWTRRGDLLSENGEPANALKFYDRAIAADAHYVLAYLGKALVLEETPGNTDEAVRCLQTAMDLDPESVWLPVEMGNIHYGRKDYKEAARFYAKATELDPKSAVAWGNLGLAQDGLEDYAGALESAEKRLALDPTSADGWVHKGLFLSHLERRGESTASYQKALELDPRDFWANNNMGWNLTKMQKYEEALPFYEKAIEVNPTEEVSWLNKAQNLRESGRYHDALDVLNRAIEAVRDKLDILYATGLIYSDYLYLHDKALACFEQCLRLDPSNIQIRAAIAECLIKMGRYAEGRAEAEKLVGQLNDVDADCCLSLVILASYAFEGDVNGRARQFEVVLEKLNLCHLEGKPEELTWAFGGLLNSLRVSNITSESKFLVSTAIDLHQGKLARSSFSFFDAGKPQTAMPSTREARGKDLRKKSKEQKRS
jgi:tetratricopeptide (TPR) repeat protein